MTALYTILLLVVSNAFMTFAWYGHLKFSNNGQHKFGLPLIILMSWGIAFFEYVAQVPANRMGYVGNGGPFDIWQLKVIQEVITLTVFVVFAVALFKTEPLKMNHLIGFGFLVLAVYFIFK